MYETGGKAPSLQSIADAAHPSRLSHALTAADAREAGRRVHGDPGLEKQATRTGQAFTVQSIVLVLPKLKPTWRIRL